MPNTKISDLSESCSHSIINHLTGHCKGCGKSLVEIDKLRRKGIVDPDLYVQNAIKHGFEKCGGCGALVKDIGLGCNHCKESKESYQKVKEYLRSKDVFI